MNKKKKSTNLSPYPDEAIERLARAFYPAILACWNSEEGQRSLVGARPLHLANARPFGRLKAPLGLSLLRCAAQTRACRMAGGAGSHLRQRKTGSSRWGTPCLTYRVWIFQGASGRAHPVFAFSPLVRDSQPRSSNIPPVRRSESVQHMPAGRCR